MGEKYTDAQRRATLKYLSEKTDDVRVRVPKGTKERWRTAAEVEGKSLQRFIIDAILHCASLQLCCLLGGDIVHSLTSFTACHLQCAAAILHRPGFLPVSANRRKYHRCGCNTPDDK